jgi:hypothetical protein
MDYKCYPTWVYNDYGEIISNDIVDELQNEVEIKEILDDTQNIYNILFIDNQIIFEYKGFSSENEKTDFINKINLVMKLRSKKIGYINILENKVNV